MSLVDGMLAGLLALVLLALLGVLRELAFLRDEVAAVRASSPREGMSPGQPLSERLAALLAGRLMSAAGDVHSLVFLSSGCGSCASYAEDIARLVGSHELDQRDVTVVVEGGAARLTQSLRSAGVTVVADTHGGITRQTGLGGTPTTVVVDVTSGTVRSVWPGSNPGVLTAPRPEATEG